MPVDATDLELIRGPLPDRLPRSVSAPRLRSALVVTFTSERVCIGLAHHERAIERERSDIQEWR